MKLREYPLLVDENIHPDVLAALRAAGRDVVSVRESQLIGSDDRTLLRLAKAQGQIVLTHDSDFGTLAIAERESFVGIAYLRPGHIRPEFTLETLQALFAQDTELTEPFIVVGHRSGDRVKIRIRSPIIAPPDTPG